MSRARLVALALAALLAVVAGTAGAHAFRPAYLELRQTGAETWDVQWKVPALGTERRLALYVRMPADAQALAKPVAVFGGDAYVERWSVRRPGGLDGQRIAIDGLAGSASDVLVRIERQDGTSQALRVLPDDPGFVVEPQAGSSTVARTYVALGVEHILGGIDHLLFVLALLLIVRGAGRLVATITAFTLAHSLTLALATLGVVSVPQAPVEAVIALSIAFVAAEIVRERRGQPGLAARKPWVVAFAFGLLHGLGFAGALHEVGLPEHAIPLALVCFNVGVEIGQLLFIAAVAAAAALVRRVRIEPPRWLAWAPAYAIGGVAMFWVIERVAAFA